MELAWYILVEVCLAASARRRAGFTNLPATALALADPPQGVVPHAYCAISDGFVEARGSRASRSGQAVFVCRPRQNSLASSVDPPCGILLMRTTKAKPR